jgi:DNA invertase Pin-like site-specific DNA recombinase
MASLVFTILSAVAEAERDRIRERISIVKADLKTRGRFLGGNVPFGYRLEQGGCLVEDAGQQAAIAEMRAMHQRGLSLRAIAALIQARGHTLSHVGVQQALKRAR